MHDALLAAVIQQVHAANDSAQHLTAAALELKESYKFSRRLKAILAIGAGVMALLLLLLTVQVIITFDNHSLAAKIDSCTNPGSKDSPPGKCYADGSARSQAAVAAIVALDLKNAEMVAVCQSSPSVISAATANNDKAYLAALIGCVEKLKHS